jgi:hypothetical protein
MNAHQGRSRGGANVTQPEDYGLFSFGWPYTFESKDPEVAETAWKIGFGYFIQFEIGQTSIIETEA